MDQVEDQDNQGSEEEQQQAEGEGQFKIDMQQLPQVMRYGLRYIKKQIEIRGH